MIGRVIASRYRLEKKLGSGAMGAVYKARHIKVGRAFAIKLLHVDLLEDAKLRRRFVREAELAGSLSHSNIVRVTDVGETFEGLHFIAMEYAEGPTLGEVIAASAPIPAPRIIGIATQLLDGLHHAHKHGLIHRDFKPDNVIVVTELDGKESPRIVDFGIAVVRDDASNAERERLTTAGITLGTPHYMAPEHVTGQAIDHRIDLFALGVVLYEMLCGKMPFDGDGVDVARANLLEETPPMSNRAPDVDVDPLLEAFTRMLLAKAPDARPASAKAARDLLDLIARDRAKAAAVLGVTIDDAPLPARAAKGSTSPVRPAASASLPPPSRPAPPPLPPAHPHAPHAAQPAPAHPHAAQPAPAHPAPAHPHAAHPAPVHPHAAYPHAPTSSQRAPSHPSPLPPSSHYTPPTPYLAVPEPISYSPSGQHAYIGPPPTAESSPEPTGPLQIADPTGPYVVTTFPESSGPTRAHTPSPSGAYRTRSARVSQAPLPRDGAPLPRNAVGGLAGAPLPRDGALLPRDAVGGLAGAPTVPRADSQSGVPRADSQSGVPRAVSDGGSRSGRSVHVAPQPRDGARRASTESARQARRSQRNLYIMIGAAVGALALGAVLAVLLS